MDEGLQSLILANPPINAIRKYLKENGRKTLKEIGNEKVLEGVTTMEEITRATSAEM